MWNLGKCIDDLMCKAEIETQMERTDIWIPREMVGIGRTGRLELKRIHY